MKQTLRGGLENRVNTSEKNNHTKISGRAFADSSLFFDESIRLPSHNFWQNGSWGYSNAKPDNVNANKKLSESEATGEDITEFTLRGPSNDFASSKAVLMIFEW